MQKNPLYDSAVPASDLPQGLPTASREKNKLLEDVNEVDEDDINDHPSLGL